MDARYTVVLMEIKERGVVSIKKERYIIFIVAEFYMKLSVYSHVRNFLLIELPFSFEIVVFVFRVRYDFERIIQIKFYKYFVRRLFGISVFI
jgi:hypothetical protein